jgi:hypothetical protein
VSLGDQLKVVGLLCLIGITQILVAATSVGLVDLASRPGFVLRSIGLADAAIPFAQLAFGGVMAWRMMHDPPEA